MVDRIGGSESLWREAILAAQKELARGAGGVARDARALQDAARSFADRVNLAAPGTVRPEAPRPPAAASAPIDRPGPAAGDGLGGLRDVADSLREVDELPRAMVAGEVSGFQELAVRVKSADLSFRFALEVRNKLIDAYREVMRMSV